MDASAGRGKSFYVLLRFLLLFLSLTVVLQLDHIWTTVLWSIRPLIELALCVGQLLWRQTQRLPPKQC